MSSKAQTRSRHLQPPSSEPPPREAQICPDIQDHIGQHLRAMYDRLKTEPVPDRLLDLLKRLDKTEPEQSR
jgi:Anti-sigma factor NepR